MDCAAGTSIYRLTLLDSAGDGWQGASYTVRNSSALAHTSEGAIVGLGLLVDGYSSTEWLCLANGCYELEVTAGSAPGEIGIEFHDEGGGHFSGRGAPFSDHFCVADGSVFAHPTQSPSLSVLPSLAPTESPPCTDTDYGASDNSGDTCADYTENAEDGWNCMSPTRIFFKGICEFSSFTMLSLHTFSFQTLPFSVHFNQPIGPILVSHV